MQTSRWLWHNKKSVKISRTLELVISIQIELFYMSNNAQKMKFSVKGFLRKFE